MTLEQRSWGDGKGFSPQGVKFFQDSRRSWIRKQEIVAESSACGRPARHRRQMMKRYHIRDTEKAARYALIEDMWQNHLYMSMIDMVKAKGDDELLRDITETIHPSAVFRNYEPEAVPNMYIQGNARGFANDDAYAIISPISKINFDRRLKPETKRVRISRALNKLEGQVQRSATLAELKRNFFRVYRRRNPLK